MNTSNLLHRNREEVKKLILGKLGKSPKDLENDKIMLKNWLQYQKHLPEIPNDTLLDAFLVVNKFNLEKCKKKLINYYKIRKEIPEFYINKNRKLEHMQIIANVVYIIPLPKLTPSLSRVTVIKLKDINPDKFNALNFFAYSYNLIEIRIREDNFLTDTLIYDMEGLQLGHLFKLRFAIMRKAALVLEKVFSTRLEAIHYINMASSMQVLINFVKTMLKEKMRKRIHLHKEIRGLHDFIPKEILPQDFGGNCINLNVLHALWLDKLEEHQELFDYLETFNFADSNEKQKFDEESVGYLNFHNICID